MSTNKKIILKFKNVSNHSSLEILKLRKLEFEFTQSNSNNLVKCKKAIDTNGDGNSKLAQLWSKIDRAVFIQHLYARHKLISGSFIEDDTVWTFVIEIVKNQFSISVVDNSSQEPFKPRGPASAVGTAEEVEPLLDED